MTTLPPLDRAERAILGGILIAPPLLTRVRTMLRAGQFSCLRHNAIFAAACTLADRGEPVDQVTCGALLEAQGVLAKIGGAIAFDGLTDEVALETKIEAYCDLVREQHCRRQMVRAGAQIAEAGQGDVADVPAYLEDARARVAAVAAGAAPADPVPTMAEATRDAFDEAVQTAEPVGLVPTGIATFDRHHRGLWPCYVVIGGFPGAGKTTTLINLILNAARGGRRALFFSMEDRRRMVLWRMLAILSGIDSRRIILRRLRPEDHQALISAATILRELPIVIDDRTGRTGAQIRADALRCMDERPVDLVVVDHLAKLREAGRSPYERVTAASAALVDLQGQLGVPLIAASQLGRPESKTEIRPPRLNDLRDSGMIEADARMVLLLHRPHYYYEIRAVQDEPDVHELGLAVAKNNYGLTGGLKLHIDLPSGYVGDPTGEVPGDGY